MRSSKIVNMLVPTGPLPHVWMRSIERSGKDTSDYRSERAQRPHPSGLGYWTGAPISFTSKRGQQRADTEVDRRVLRAEFLRAFDRLQEEH
eukprot:1404883-Pyramimonas_sp.AAC.1